jgi:3-deoxy-7-phosphoheptulonate synthase
MIVTMDKRLANGAHNMLAAVVARNSGMLRTIDWGDGTLSVGIDGELDADVLTHPAILTVVRGQRPYQLTSNEHRDRTVVTVGDVEIGSGRPILIAGPCVVSDETQLLEAAWAVKGAGAQLLRGGAFKPRTSPYSFQGLGEDGLRLLARTRESTGLPIVTEVLEPEQVEMTAYYADMLQIGTRNMANTPLLRRVGRTRKPVLLKRGFSATIEEWLMSAEYILSEGNSQVVLCERGVRGFDPALRFNLDLNAVPYVKELTHLPVIVDPSHGTGKRSLVGSMALAGIAAGADGLIIESEPNPDGAKCDAAQTIPPDELVGICARMRAIADLVSPNGPSDPVDRQLVTVA